MPARRMARLVIYVRSRVGSLRSRVRLLLRPRPAALYVHFLVSLLPCITKSARGCVCRERAAQETAEQEPAEQPAAEEEPAPQPAAEQDERNAAGWFICRFVGCEKLAQTATNRWDVPGYCVAHGGGHRCRYEGCTVAASRDRDGRTEFCIRHGGGLRCQHEGCNKGAHWGGENGRQFCIVHGGGFRCQAPGCGRGAMENAEGEYIFCKGHGGGYRCQAAGCPSSATMGPGLKVYCRKHGPQCSVDGCTNGVTKSGRCYKHQND